MIIVLTAEEQQGLVNSGITRQNFYALFHNKQKLPVAIFSNKKAAEYWQAIQQPNTTIKQVRVRV